MADSTKRANYFDRQFLRAKDLQDEQAYALDRRRRHNRVLHTLGVADGLSVEGANGATSVVVKPGTAIDSQGREIVLSADRTVNVPSGTGVFKVYITYNETPSDPSLDPGVTGFTRVEEQPTITILSASIVTGSDLVSLATIELTNGHLSDAVDNTTRPVVGSVLSDNTVTQTKMANNAVTSRAVAPADAGTDQTLTTGSGIKTGHIKDQAITTTKLGDGAVTTSKLGPNAVTTAQIVDGNITMRKLGGNPVIDVVVNVPAMIATAAVPFANALTQHGFFAISVRATAGTTGTTYMWRERRTLNPDSSSLCEVFIEKGNANVNMTFAVRVYFIKDI